MKINILTLFPEMYKGFLETSIIKRAIQNKIIDVNLINFRDFTEDKHKKVDDYPYGGGAGMLLKVQPIYDALKSIPKSKTILMSPQGETLVQKKVIDFSQKDELTIICGHYEGYDERIRGLIDCEVSVGDYILTGGELGSMVLVDSITRLLKGAISKEESHINDSFSDGLLEHPHYTRPENYKGMSVPDVLLSGNHKSIQEYRRYESLKKTYLNRKDLLLDAELSIEDEKMLQNIKEELK